MFELYDKRETPRNVTKAREAAEVAGPYLWERFDTEAAEGFADEAPPLASGRAVGRPGAGYGLDQIMSEAEGILQEAEEQAERYLAEARLKLEAERTRLYEEALAEARAQLAADPQQLQAAEELRRATLAVGQLLEQLELVYQQRLAELEKQAVDGAFTLARMVLDQELQTRPEVVVGTVRQALQRAGSGELTVRLNPADLPVVQASLLELQAERNPGDLLSFQEDANVERGGCLVTGETGTVDAQPTSILSQLREIAEP